MCAEENEKRGRDKQIGNNDRYREAIAPENKERPAQYNYFIQYW